jgi:hypothetical protein
LLGPKKRGGKTQAHLEHHEKSGEENDRLLFSGKAKPLRNQTDGS